VNAPRFSDYRGWKPLCDIISNRYKEFD
jgi:hypothetical protein